MNILNIIRMKITNSKNTNFILLNIIPFLLLPLLLLLLYGCGNNDAQRQFEQEAFQRPSGITETEPNGTVISDDPDDWRIAPDFQGLVEVSPAFPNPVLTNEQLRIEFTALGIVAVSGLEVAVLFEDGSIRSLFIDNSEDLPPGLQVIPIDPQQLGRFQSEITGLHRILIFDLNRKIISYGDVEVE